ncbi:MAG: hypothetical protein CTY36_13120 [Methylocystis sp.]|uniref:Uncharacterized protein n=1 Tax=Methylocystis rosea TaxID=173366 RepID=A0A3G8MAT3_9HYPH|nr:hypothetical protein [Methylocystis rosea]AZG78330.1 hypothetical protein EHO51_17215 [Methylocystis rosea]PPC93050.1 MAG: hypothetical protein CTY36_13120 [Methylocystis sp.]
MNWLLPITRQTFDAPCRVEIGHTAESLFAHVEIEGDFDIRPGDRVFVQNAPVEAPFGYRVTVERRATIIRAGLIERLWARFLGNFELTELYDVSFTNRRAL